MDGKTPDVVFAEQLATKRTCDARLLDMLCLRRIDKTSSGAPLRIGQNGIAYKGLRYGQYALAGRLGEAVIIRVDDEDLSEVLVFDARRQFLCVAPCNEKVPKNATAQVLREAHASKRAIARSSATTPSAARAWRRTCPSACCAQREPRPDAAQPPAAAAAVHFPGSTPARRAVGPDSNGHRSPEKDRRGGGVADPAPQGGFSFTPSQPPATSTMRNRRSRPAWIHLSTT
jgi:hypothetical protein